MVVGMDLGLAPARHIEWHRAMPAAVRDAAPSCADNAPDDDIPF
jgi:hypothetical protein